MIKMKFLVFIYFVLSSYISFSQTNVWNTLGLVTYKKSFDAEFGIETKNAQVSPLALALNGKEIEVSGYIIALEVKKEQSHFMFSKFNQNMCFFCGKAGPETAMQVFMKNDKKVAYSDDKIKVKGILRIDPKDANSLLYTLEQAILVQ
jgi:hypothetical protein